MTQYFVARSKAGGGGSGTCTVQKKGDRLPNAEKIAPEKGYYDTKSEAEAYINTKCINDIC